MWQKKESKLELAASMVRQVMPALSKMKNVIILCDSWYVKKNLVSIVDEYENLDLIGNARSDSAILVCHHSVPEKRAGQQHAGADSPSGTTLCSVMKREAYRNFGLLLADKYESRYFMLFSWKTSKPT